MSDNTHNSQAGTGAELLTLIGQQLNNLLQQAQSEALEYPASRQGAIELSRLRQSVADFSKALQGWANVPDGIAEVITDLRHPNPGRFQVGDLVQLKSEYVAHGNPSLFQIVEIVDGEAALEQLSSKEEGFVGCGVSVDLDDPELIAPFPETLQRYAFHARAAMSRRMTIAVLMGFNAMVDTDDGETLYSHSDAATFALHAEDLPYGAWTAQGFAFEQATMITVPVDSPEAQSAIANSYRRPK
ncbi:hypothetical protein A5761_11330 [Mycolicibacterium setense]|uniref:hypothetical protein n=1 Tax=Mycolicibacterium setense TaxID=431269 RepID=UPI0007EBAB81|nr:hypothetical protein [Mycolicibacterium setense]OBB17037.1 hypothetical protein A5761_11330 [Mycolicibacterium setense]